MDDSVKGNKSDGETESPEDEEVDPRIQGELEKLNQSTDDINRWESDLEDSRKRFRAVLVEATLKLDEQVKKIGKAVEDSKPYWEARKVARQAQVEAQRATQEFQRAIEILRAAKETIALAEERLLEEDSRQFDSAWQEMLNHATQRVMEAEQSRTHSELEHKETAARYTAAVNHVRQLEKKLKRTVNKSRPYFELKAKYYLQLEQLKRRVDECQAKLTQAKADYRSALCTLEAISDEIHTRRRLTAMGPRVCGVGAERDMMDGDIANFKTESDGISVMSETFEESCNGVTSEEDPETQSTCSLSSNSTPVNLPRPYLATPSSPYPLLSSSSSSSTTPSPPTLGPRRECSGASSPECDGESSGSENEPRDTYRDSGGKWVCRHRSACDCTCTWCCRAQIKCPCLPELHTLPHCYSNLLTFAVLTYKLVLFFICSCCGV
uniref:SH3 domain-binding protein 5 n=1 Tax=Electrophorus electricus TaxID=8005 RepID=A0A4W4FW82_ELEEL